MVVPIINIFWGANACKIGFEMVRISKNGLKDLNPYFSSTIKKNIDFEIFGYGIKSVSNYIIDVFDLINKKININDLNNDRATFKKSLVTVKITEAVITSLKTGKKIKI